MTFSIVARCARTGMLGVAVLSSSPAVAARCAYARARVGAEGSQNITDPTLGPRLLDVMALGATAPEALCIVVGSVAHIAFRQLIAVDSVGRTGVFYGSKTLGTYAAAEGESAADLAHGFVFARWFRNAASPASETSTHFLSGAASAT